MNPHATTGGRHTCLITTRDLAQAPVDKSRDKLERNPIVEILAALPIVSRILNYLFDRRPAVTPKRIDQGLRALVDDEYTNLSYKVLNIGAANHLPAYSSEIGVPVDGRGLHLTAVDTILAIAERHRAAGDVYHTAPVALRFVRSSPAFLSMMYGVDTMMIELIQMTDTEGGFELLAAYEDALYALSGRPHWGQYNTLTGSRDFLRSLYPGYDRWLAVYRRLNATRVFDSPLTKRVGISDPVAQSGGAP